MLARSMPLRVFISYSTKEDTEAQAALDIVRESLKNAGHDVFVDKRDIALGYPWRQRILCEVMGCHVGVILFSKGALLSDWVLYEAQIMSIRKELFPHFTLLPVLLQDVRVEELKKERFAPLALDQWQISQERAADAIARELVDRLQQIPRYDTHLEELGKRIAVELSNLTQTTLEYVFPQLGLDASSWNAHERQIALANALARLAMSEGMKGILHIIRVLAPYLGSQKAQTLLDILAPLWIHMDVAARLPQINDRRPPSWCVGINGRYVPGFTAKMVLGRAYWPARREFIQVAGGAGEDLVNHIRQDMLESIKSSRNFLTEEEADEYLRGTSETIFVSIPKKLWERESLRVLRDTYPSVTFLLDTGETPPAGSHNTLPSEFESLPQVDLLEERQAWIGYGDAKGIIRNHP
jgi:hypothetical protein